MWRCAFLWLVALSGTAIAQEPRFDPFSRGELEKIVELLIQSGRTDATTRLARVTRLPSAKDAQPDRRARLAAVIGGQTLAIDVDLDGSTLTFGAVNEGFAPITSSDWARANAVLRSDPRWIEAMRLRGIENHDDVFCESLSAGYFPGGVAADTAVVRLPCYLVSDATTNIYGRPIEGLIATVDLKKEQVIDILDEGVQPLPGQAEQLPLAVAAPRLPPHPRISFDGQRVAFGPWSVHVSLDDQFGLVVGDVTFFDGKKPRQILHTGHVSEVFVPYMDVAESWGFRTYLDAGEFGLGVLASPLVPGVDCPASASYIDSHHLTPTARVVSRPRTICVFAQDLRGPLWRHYEALNDLSAGASGEELVVRSISSIAHYDYIFDWVFRPSGEIEIRIGATGIDAVKAEAGLGNAPEGARVTSDLVAVFHDHFFSLRLDVDIDGDRNRLVREKVVVDRSRDNSLGRSYWSLEAQTITTEGPLVDGEPGIWRIASAGRAGAFGEMTGYQILPEGTVSVLHPEDYPQRRAAFSAAPMWVTQNDPEERAASGDYPNQHPGGAGLPAFANGEAIVDTDLVLWPTVGFRHVTRVEDWPALSTIWKAVVLRPYGFFDGNPAIEQ